MASYDDEYVEVDAADAEAAEIRLGASEAVLASCKEEQQSFLDCLDLQPRSELQGTSGQSADDDAADDDGEGGGRTKPSESRHVLNARYSTDVAAVRPPRPLCGCIVTTRSTESVPWPWQPEYRE